MANDTLFIIDPMNAPFINGEAERPPDYLIGVVFAVIVLFVLPMIALNLLVAGALLDTESGVTGSLILVMLVMISIDAILLGAAWWFWRRFSLKRNGVLVDGEVVRAEGEVRPGPQGNEFIVTLWYRFTSPKSGKSITGTIAGTRDDLADSPLPRAGDRVAVLYVGDRNYRVM